MNKSDLVYQIAAKSHVTQKAAAEMLEACLTSITTALQQGEPVSILGFGTFDISHRAPRKAFHWKTGEHMMFPAAIVPKFRPGKLLKLAVNQAEATVAEAVT